MVMYTNKYIKYKLKYISLIKKLLGGGISQKCINF